MIRTIRQGSREYGAIRNGERQRTAILTHDFRFVVARFVLELNFESRTIFCSPTGISLSYIFSVFDKSYCSAVMNFQWCVKSKHVCLS